MNSPMTPIESAEWTGSLLRVLEDQRRLRIVFQPIVDLHRGRVVGYEALSRFAGASKVTPADWFAAAEMAGLSDELETIAITAALKARADLPPNTFLSINVNPNSLTSPDVAALFERQGDLSRLVIEITERAEVTDYKQLAGVLQRYRRVGALVAVDDAGAGYASLLHVITLRPDFVKLDRSMVAGVDHDAAKIALIEMLNQLANRLDAWVIAEGLERTEELNAAVNLNVPLGQGYLLGRPAVSWTGLSPGLDEHIRRRSEMSRATTTVGQLTQAAPSIEWWEWRSLVGGLFEDPKVEMVIATDEFGRPVGVVSHPSKNGALELVEHILKVTEATDIIEALRRAMSRPTGERFKPLVCCDSTGRYVGIVRVERLVDSLTSMGAETTR